VRLGRTILVVVGATVLLAALVGTASAGRLSTSSLGIKATWARINFTGGGGTVECEVVVEGAFHERTISKTRGTLSGFLTSARITRCSRGAVTVLSETLPWHLRYDSFTGSLPNITSVRATIVGVAFRIREPVFGIECLSRTTAEEPGNIVFNRETGTGATVSAVVGGTVRCGGGFAGTFSGSTNNIDNGSGTRITVTLI
jgi:hypothetical protein